MCGNNDLIMILWPDGKKSTYLFLLSQHLVEAGQLVGEGILLQGMGGIKRLWDKFKEDFKLNSYS